MTSPTTIAALLAAADRGRPLRLGELIGRLSAAGALRGARAGG